MGAAISLRPLHTDTDGHRAYCLACWEERQAAVPQAHAAFLEACYRYQMRPCYEHKLLVLGAYEMVQDAIRERDRV